MGAVERPAQADGAQPSEVIAFGSSGRVVISASPAETKVLV